MDVLNGLIADAGLQEALIGLFGIILTIIIRRTSAAFTAATGIAIEEKHQRALHSAIKSGIEAAIEDGPEAGIEQIKAAAIFHAQQSVPDAIRALVPGDGVLDRLAVRYYREAMERMGVGVPVLN
ncbi:hypothetical protein [uncultured Salipiger sp.]|uniref:hypothetical protein n=1 Tax=uncultured Salipiger sp. TaxID=499810 RepID=UPI002592FC48|nr:hypothetical protein [uncultured Salipiger sp.]